jgi:hypothetical protein
MRVHLALCLAALLCACAATGERFSEHEAGASAVPDTVARLIVYRPERILYAARNATLKVDGVGAGTIASYGFRVFEVDPGSHVLLVDMWDVPGTCELSLNAEAGFKYYFEVQPRESSFLAGLGGLAFPAITATGLALSTAATVGGMAVESSFRECGGAFAIMPVEESTALPKLARTRLSE